jgi:hypothetical protein
MLAGMPAAMLRKDVAKDVVKAETPLAPVPEKFTRALQFAAYL